MSEAPADALRTAVLLAAHGDRGTEKANTALLAHCRALAQSGHFTAVTAGVLKGDPSLEHGMEAALASAPDRVLIYPFFMADGFFVRTRLAERVRAMAIPVPYTVSQPLGLAPALPALMLRQAQAAARQAGLSQDQSDLLIVGHGSQLGPASADATRAAAEQVARLGTFRAVSTAFLEEPPSVEEALSLATQPVVVSGFFSEEGLHAGEDVPDAITKSGARAIYAGAIGGDASVCEVILNDLLAYAARSRAAT